MSGRKGAFLLVTFVLAAGAVFATSCGSSNPVPKAETAIAGPNTGVGATIEIKDFLFDPPAVLIKAGQSVTWTNEGPSTHTVTADDGSFDSGDLAPGQTFSHTFAKAGAYSYHCNHHSVMKAVVTVE